MEFVEHGVDANYGEGHEDDDEDGVDELHLVGIDGEEAHLPVHLGRLNHRQKELVVLFWGQQITCLICNQVSLGVKTILN